MKYNTQILVLLIRLVATSTLLIDPFWGFIIANTADALDVVLLDLFHAKALKNYHMIDKILDMQINLFALLIVLNQSWSNNIKVFAFLLFWLRIIGVAYFIFTNTRKVFLITPNFFYYLAFYLIFIDYFNLQDDISNSSHFIIISALFLFNYFQEYVLHFKKYKPWQMLKLKFS